MKKYWALLIISFFIGSISSIAYIDPLGNLSLDEIRESSRAGQEVEQEYNEENMDRLSRDTDMWGQSELVETKSISYPDPLRRAGQHGSDRNVRAFENSYSDGTTEIITEDGRVLKVRD